MSSYGSAHSGHLHPGFQPPPQHHQQRARSQSNPPYPTTPAAAPYPLQQQGYFPPQPTGPYQPTSNPIAIPSQNPRRSSDYTYTYGSNTSPSYPPPAGSGSGAGSYSTSYPAQHLPPIPQHQPIPGSYQYSPQPQPAPPSTSPTHHHDRRRSSTSTYNVNPRHSYESARSWQSVNEQPGVDDIPYTQHSQYGSGYDGQYNEIERPAPQPLPLPAKGYGDWDKREVRQYYKERDLEKRPTLGGSLMSLVKRVGGERR